MQQLESHLHAGDRPAASRLLHTLRGVASTLGLVELAAQSQQLEQDLANNSQTLAERMAPLPASSANCPVCWGKDPTQPQMLSSLATTGNNSCCARLRSCWCRATPP